jgi:hypothetical protein
MLVSHVLLNEICTLHCLLEYPLDNGLHVLNLFHSFFRQKRVYLIHLLNERENRIVKRRLVGNFLLSTRYIITQVMEHNDCT